MNESGNGDRGWPTAFPAAAVPSAIAAACPEWPSVFGQAQEATISFFMAVGEARIKEPRSATTILNQGANEFQDLLVQASSGEGRMALAAARVLFELLVAFRDVSASAEMDDRYSSWGAVSQQLLAGLILEEKALSGVDLKAHRHRTKKLVRDSRKDYEAAITRYGSDFRRNWAGQSLFERAHTHGLDDLYDFYRVASGVLHGTQAGTLGLERATFGRTLRMGPALAWAPLALLYGAELFGLMARSSSALVKVTAPEVDAAMREIRQIWPAFQKAVLKLDEDIWPSEPTPGRSAVYGMGPHGSGRWYLHDRDRGLIAPALPPVELPPGTREAIEGVRKRLDQSRFWDDPDALTGVLGHVTVNIEGVMVERDPKHFWMPDVAILLQNVSDDMIEGFPVDGM